MRVGNSTPLAHVAQPQRELAPTALDKDKDQPQQIAGRLGTIRIFESDRVRTIDPPPTTVSGKSGWDSLGVLSPTMFSALDSVRGQAHEKSLNGGGQWRDAQSFGPNAWSLDVTAELLSGNVRC